MDKVSQTSTLECNDDSMKKRLANLTALLVQLHRKGYRGVVKINLADGNISKKVRIEDTVEIG